MSSLATGSTGTSPGVQLTRVDWHHPPGMLSARSSCLGLLLGRPHHQNHASQRCTCSLQAIQPGGSAQSCPFLPTLTLLHNVLQTGVVEGAGSPLQACRSVPRERSGAAGPSKQRAGWAAAGITTSCPLTVHDVALLQQQLRKVAAVLAAHPRDEGHLLRHAGCCLLRLWRGEVGD